MKNKNIVTMIINIIINLMVIGLSANYKLEVSLILTIISNLILLYNTISIFKDFKHILFVFITFFMLYGISGPVNVFWGTGLPKVFKNYNNILPFMIILSIANIAINIGILTSNRIITKERNHKKIIIRKKYLNYGILLLSLASIMEIINLYRIGGPSILFSGKAIYQAKISNLYLALPSNIIGIIGTSIFALSLKSIDDEKIKKVIFLAILLHLPYIIILMILGKRGVILSELIIFLIAYTFENPIRRINRKQIKYLIVIYIFLSFLYINRGISFLIKENPKLYFEKLLETERIISGLNPGSNEFGAAYGNFSEFYEKYEYDFTPELGKTYFNGLVLPIPRFIYPGTKPQQLVYKFRDEFFYAESYRSSIASTGYSSLLEAYLNFKYIGIFIVYYSVTKLLIYIDNVWRHTNIFTMIVYSSSFPLVRTFHRSDFGTVYVNVFYIFVFSGILFLFLRKKN